MGSTAKIARRHTNWNGNVCEDNGAAAVAGLKGSSQRTWWVYGRAIRLVSKFCQFLHLVSTAKMVVRFSMQNETATRFFQVLALATSHVRRVVSCCCVAYDLGLGLAFWKRNHNARSRDRRGHSQWWDQYIGGYHAQSNLVVKASREALTLQ